MSSLGPRPPITFISKIKIGFLEMNDEAVKSCAAQLKLFGTLECVKRLVSLGLVEVSLNRRWWRGRRRLRIVGWLGSWPRQDWHEAGFWILSDCGWRSGSAGSSFQRCWVGMLGYLKRKRLVIPVRLKKGFWESLPLDPWTFQTSTT